MPARKILFINHDSRMDRGGANCIIELANRLDRNRFKPMMLFPSPGPLAESLKDVPAYFLGESPRYRYPDILKIRRIIKREGIDLVHANTVDSVMPGLAAKLSGRPLVLHLHETFPGTIRWNAIGSKLLRFADAIVVDSQNLTYFYQGMVGKNKMSVIYNSVDAEKFKFNQAQRLKVRAEWWLKEQDILILSVGYLCPAKGQFLLIEAFSMIRKKYPKAKLFFAGGAIAEFPDYLEQLKMMVQSRELENCVKFLGSRPDVPALLSAADIFVHPSLKESFSIAILEAMAAGKPVIATNVGGTAEQIDETGKLVSSGDPDELSKALDFMLSDPARAMRLGKSAQMRFEKGFSLDSLIANFSELYNKIT